MLSALILGALLLIFALRFCLEKKLNMIEIIFSGQSIG